MNWLNPQFLLSRLLERCGISTYLERVEFACHVGWGLAAALAGPIPASVWILWSILDEMVFDGMKGKDTWIDLLSRTLLPALALWGSCLGGPLAVATGAFLRGHP